jgi:hypothetical protein
MTIAEHIAMLARMEAARRETHAHLRLIERQIVARAERLITTFRARSRDYRKSRSTWSHADEQLYQATLSELAFSRHREVDGLTRKLARQDAAIAAFRRRHGPPRGLIRCSASPCAIPRAPTCDREGSPVGTCGGAVRVAGQCPSRAPVAAVRS